MGGILNLDLYFQTWYWLHIYPCNLAIQFKRYVKQLSIYLTLLKWSFIAQLNTSYVKKNYSLELYSHIYNINRIKILCLAYCRPNFNPQEPIWSSEHHQKQPLSIEPGLTFQQRLVWPKKHKTKQKQWEFRQLKIINMINSHNFWLVFIIFSLLFYVIIIPCILL